MARDPLAPADGWWGTGNDAAFKLFICRECGCRWRRFLHNWSMFPGDRCAACCDNAAEFPATLDAATQERTEP